jgi:hypothetical protein
MQVVLFIQLVNLNNVGKIKPYQLIIIVIMGITTIILFLELLEIIKNKYIPFVGYMIIFLGTVYVFYKSRKNKI